MNERLDWLDAMKGIGIFLIVLGHMEFSYTLHELIYSFHVPMFFIISGFLFNNNKKRTIFNFTLSRTKTLLIPYMSFSLISICFSYARCFVSTEKTSITTLFLKFLSGNGVESNIPLWFLKVLFIVELVFFILVKLLRSEKLVLIILLISFYFVIAISIPLFFRNILYYLTYYGIGWLARKKIENISNGDLKQPCIYLYDKDHPIYVGTIYILAIIVWLAVFKYMYDNNVSMVVQYIIRMFMAILVTVLVAGVAFQYRNSGILKYLGANSLIILCTHALIKIIISLTCRFAFKFNDKWIHDVDTLSKFIIAFLIILIEIPLIAFINRYCPFIIGKKRCMINPADKLGG